jgi:hypothetical protein
MQRCVGLPGVGRPADDAFRRRAARARIELNLLFYNSQWLCKVVNFFACFHFAERMKLSCSVKSLHNWSTEELQLLYNVEQKQLQSIDKVALLLDSLEPTVKGLWETLGYETFERYFYTFTAQEGNKKKLLDHYKKAWNVIEQLAKFNACFQFEKKFDKPIWKDVATGVPRLEQLVTVEVQGRWPDILVLINEPGNKVNEVSQYLCTFGYSGTPLSWQYKAPSRVIWKLESGTLVSLPPIPMVSILEGKGKDNGKLDNGKKKRQRET